MGKTQDEHNKFEPHFKDYNLKNQNEESVFKYFEDGTRKVYPAFSIKVKNSEALDNENYYPYPVVAGQVVIAFCKRTDGEINKHDYRRFFLLSFPINGGKGSDEKKKEELLGIINKSVLKKVKKLGLQVKYEFNDIITYDTNGKEKNIEELKNKGIDVIQNFMVEHENLLVKCFAETDTLLSTESFLMKDGALGCSDDIILEKHTKEKYRYIVGVSKSFTSKEAFYNLEELKLYHRTPVKFFSRENSNNYQKEYKESSKIFAVWFVRIRERKYAINEFDGILKVEQMLFCDMDQKDIKYGLSQERTDLIDRITTSIINERGPVCYGTDKRWANHLYPIFATECYAKSKCLHDKLFLSLFGDKKKYVKLLNRLCKKIGM